MSDRPDSIMQPRGPGRPQGSKKKKRLWVYPERTPKGKRICRRCGEDPSPNMFYCKACHDVVSDYVDDQFAVL